MIILFLCGTPSLLPILFQDLESGSILVLF